MMYLLEEATIYIIHDDIMIVDSIYYITINYSKWIQQYTSYLNFLSTGNFCT